MKFIQQILLGFVVVAILSGSMGISIQVHHCNSAKRTAYLAFPEFHTKQNHGCCKAKISGIELLGTSNSVFRKATCCNLNKMLLKINPYKIPVPIKLTDVNLLVYQVLPTTTYKNLLLFQEEQHFLPPLIREPVIVSGKEIVFSNQQLRIPSAC
jgi:hypothetical protein